MSDDLHARLEQALAQSHELRTVLVAILENDGSRGRYSAMALGSAQERAEDILREDQDREPALLREVLALRPLPEAATKAAADLRHAFIAKDDWNLVARAIRILETAIAEADKAMTP